MARTHNMEILVIGTYCTGSCKSKYYTIKTTTTPVVVFFGGFIYSLLDDAGIFVK